MRGMEVAVKVAMSQVLIDVALGPEPKRIIQAALNKARRQAAEIQDGERRDATGAPKQTAMQRRVQTNGAGARSRAASRSGRAAHAGEVWRRDSTVIDQKDRG